MATHLARLAHPSRTRAFSLISIVVVLGMFVAGCGGGGGSSGIKAGPGVDTANKTITLGILTPLTGPVAAPIGIPITKGIETYFDGVNANGGIGGYQVKFIEKDTQYNVQMQVQQYNAIHNNVLMIAESLGSPTTQAIVQLATRDQMLVSAASLDSILARQQYMILIGTPYLLQVENGFE